jgi:hypothetical protein
MSSATRASEMAAFVRAPVDLELLAGPAPCDHCPHALRCRVRQLACGAFFLYVNGAEESHWRAEPRIPKRGRYVALFGRRAEGAAAG